MRRSLRLLCFALALCSLTVLVHWPVLGSQASEQYFTWTAAQAESIGKNAYRRGRVGGIFDVRGLKTERSYNYKLAATWLTPEVIRATARLLQLRSRLPEAETRALVVEAEAIEGTVVMVEIDPREGSGVIPRDWEAFLQPKGQPERALRGTVRQDLRDIKALAGVLRRNYDYDRFWVVFPAPVGGSSLFLQSDRMLELVVRIYDKEGRVEWPVPGSVLKKTESKN